MDDSSQNNPNKPKNRKRPKSFLQNARKYAKKGTFGRGSELSEDTYQYLVRVLELYRDGFPTNEEKLLFANNVFEQTINEEINYSCNQIGCRVIETLLPFSNYEHIERFTNAFASNLRLYCADRFASHVLQALLSVCHAKSNTSDKNKESDETKTKCREFVLKISKFLLNNLEDFISDTYANHIIRTVFKLLSDMPNVNTNKPWEFEKEEKMEIEKIIDEEYTGIVKEYAERLLVWPHFKDLPNHELSSGLLQILLQALKHCGKKILKKMQKKLIEENFSTIDEYQVQEPKLPDVFNSKPATMLLETAITVAGSKQFTQIYANCFATKLKVLAKIKASNFAVQKLINYCSEKSEYEAIFDELADSFEDILFCGHTGVILSLAQACKRLGAKQGNFVQSLMNALHCSEPQERQNYFVETMIRLVPYEKLEVVKKQNDFVNLHGSILLQVMLEFNKPIKIITSLLSMEPNDLKNLFLDTKGSHIIDTYLKSQYVGEKSREKMIRKLQGTYQEFAVSKYGSRGLEAILSVAQLKQRMHIMDELAHKDGAWTGTEFGRIVAANINIQLYKRSKDEWKTYIGKAVKTKDMFAEIIGGNV